MAQGPSPLPTERPKMMMSLQQQPLKWKYSYIKIKTKIEVQKCAATMPLMEISGPACATSTVRDLLLSEIKSWSSTGPLLDYQAPKQVPRLRTGMPNVHWLSQTPHQPELQND